MDALQRAMMEDDLADMHEAAREGLAKMSVREYAKFRKTQPQLIYYHIRVGHIKEERCVCGRKVIDVFSADEFLARKGVKKNGR